MNPYTGELIRIRDDEPLPDGFVVVPPELNRAAERKLQQAERAFVSLISGGKLSRWAAAQRKARRKMAAESRKRNRRKK